MLWEAFSGSKSITLSWLFTSTHATWTLRGILVFELLADRLREGVRFITEVVEFDEVEGGRVEVVVIEVEQLLSFFCRMRFFTLRASNSDSDPLSILAGRLKLMLL